MPTVWELLALVMLALTLLMVASSFVVILLTASIGLGRERHRG